MQISDKELGIIGECARSHRASIEKFKFYSQACGDQEMKQLISSHVNKMERHMQDLVDMVQGSSTMPSYQQSGQQQGNQYGIVTPQSQHQRQY
ncbi:MAG: hypothetical protein GX318_08365 [Clostridia bacterium]|nr:hypothetical protein [Clostridia bacterium]